MIEIRKEHLTKTCSACPSQWEGVATDGTPIYIRYRYAHLSISRGVGGNVIFSKQIGTVLDGVISLSDVVEASKKTINWI